MDTAKWPTPHQRPAAASRRARALLAGWRRRHLGVSPRPCLRGAPAAQAKQEKQEQGTSLGKLLDFIIQNISFWVLFCLTPKSPEIRVNFETKEVCGIERKEWIIPTWEGRREPCAWWGHVPGGRDLSHLEVMAPQGSRCWEGLFFNCTLRWRPTHASLCILESPFISLCLKHQYRNHQELWNPSWGLLNCCHRHRANAMLCKEDLRLFP